ncbi:putative glycosyltransferase EpsF [Thalassotalea insulae]|uniref:Glycosyltransferase EpsF n=1 Tax=Thalassotalea insulae TaxID=2056778 RepID=A0ABQ6GSA5_9GAMM|nr:glycosyltransferase [Thalassotalea insulae]GLX78792.1 putative glycosyltransferase EpsF [Thalassotalea insulae]
MKKHKVLHVAGKMDLGGVESWLLGLAQELRHSNIEMDIVVHTKAAGCLDEKFKALGVNIFPVVNHKNPVQYVFNFYQLLKKNGPYQAVHSHVLYFSGVVLMAAWLAKIPLRISHVHSNRSSIEPKRGFRALYIRVMKYLVKIFANRYVAVSQEAHKSLHTGIISDERLSVLYCGVKHLDKVSIDRTLKQRLGISEEKLVLGHIGRMSEPKNHGFLLDIFIELKAKTEAVLVLIGDGELKSQVEQKIAEYGLTNDVILLGARDDAVDVMASIFDVIAFPSIYEGLPLTVVEAQAVGVPILVADNITKEAEFDPNLVSYLSLQDSADQWANNLVKISSARKKTVNLTHFHRTDFYFPNHIIKLKRLYLGE